MGGAIGGISGADFWDEFEADLTKDEDDLVGGGTL